MSFRVSKLPVIIPGNVSVEIKDRCVELKGPKGQGVYTLSDGIEVQLEKQNLTVVSQDKVRFRAMLGTVQRQLSNLVYGITQGFNCSLRLVGVGYRAQLQGRVLQLNLGYSHPVEFSLPAGIEATLPSATEIVLSGVDKQQVTHTASVIRGLRPPEPYKGKGVRLRDEVVVLKETKK